MSKIYIFLFNNKIPLWKYCLNSWLLTTIPGLFILKAIILIFNIEDDEINTVNFDDLFNIFKNIILNPLIETFIIAFFIHWLKQFFENKNYIVLISALLFAALHFRFKYPFWFLGVLWPSLVISISYFSWKPKSFWKAYAVCTIIHVLHNGSGYLLSKIL